MEKEVVFKLLYFCFLSIRYEALENKNEKIFNIANLFHNLPLKIKDLTTNEEFAEILNNIEIVVNGAKDEKLKEWFFNTKSKIVNSSILPSI